MLSKPASKAYLYMAWIFLILIPVQFLLAGTGVFTTNGYALHMYNGLILHVLAGGMIVFALLGRMPRRAFYFAAIQFILIGLQIAFVQIWVPGAQTKIAIEPAFITNMFITLAQPIHNALGSSAGWIASLHALNGLAIAGVAVLTVRYARSEFIVDRTLAHVTAPAFSVARTASAPEAAHAPMHSSEHEIEPGNG